MSKDLQSKLIYSLAFALILYIALALWSDWQDLTAAVSIFPWRLMPIVIGLTLVNYGGRLARWHWYLRSVVRAPISLRDSARIFGVGMMMVMTPGKAGEFFKSYMVKNVSGTPMSKTAPIILAERVLDGLAMIILAGLGLFAYPNPAARAVAAAVFAVFAGFIVVIQIRPLAIWFLERAERMPLISRFAAQLEQLYESSYVIFSPRNMTISLLTGLLCWSATGLAYYVVLTGFGVTPGLMTAGLAIFIFNISTVIGAVIALPGGLGGVEGSMVAWSSRLFQLSSGAATAAALLTRFCTLWMGVAIGLVCFLLWPELLAGSESAERNKSSVIPTS
ncbi:MAG: flippase-like domain-containing protein [Caldilineaceae bacterium]|nr:flippase-like domain-containing protein [Caldilineaceae bacterium]